MTSFVQRYQNLSKYSDEDYTTDRLSVCAQCWQIKLQMCLVICAWYNLHDNVQSAIEHHGLIICHWSLSENVFCFISSRKSVLLHIHRLIFPRNCRLPSVSTKQSLPGKKVALLYQRSAIYRQVWPMTAYHKFVSDLANIRVFKTWGLGLLTTWSPVQHASWHQVKWP